MSIPATLSPTAFEEALLRGDRRQCHEIVISLLAQGYSGLELYEGYFKPALYAIGALWEANRISVATEHLATAIVEGLMNEIFPRLVSLERTGHSIVVAPLEGELHHVGARMVCDLFEMHGWDTVLLSGDTSVAALVDTVQASRPDLIGLSFSLQFHFTTLRRTITTIRENLPVLPILVGGQALTRIHQAELERLTGITCFRDLTEVHEFIHRYMAHRS